MKKSEFGWKIKAMRKHKWGEVKIKEWFINIFKLSEEEFNDLLNGKPKRKYLQKKEECYFCKDKKIIKHHVIYKPEVLLYLCKSCHNKLHFVLRQTGGDIK